ncbi:PilN domain-containing protein [Ahniella affigens]|nr:PilN domain-containing protein [Ahniella affigens]
MSLRSSRLLFVLPAILLAACSQVESPETEAAVAPPVSIAPGEDCPDLTGVYGMAGGGQQWFLQELPARQEPQLVALSLNELKTQYRLRTLVTEATLQQWTRDLREREPDQYERWLQLMNEREALRKKGQVVDAVERDMGGLGLVPDHVRIEPRRRCTDFWMLLGEVPNDWYPGSKREPAETELWAGRASNGDLLLRFDRYEIVDSLIITKGVRSSVSHYFVRWPKVQASGMAWEIGPELLPKPKPKINLAARADALVALNAELLEHLGAGMVLTRFAPPDDGGKAMREAPLVPINLSGTSPSNQLISEFLRWLTNSGHFKNVELVSIRQDDGVMVFDIQCKWQAPLPDDSGP